jgi:DNA primase
VATTTAIPTIWKDLKGATVVLCPDRDVPGVKHCLDIEQDFPKAQWLYVYPDSPLWDNLPSKDGLDIADWVADYQLTAEAVLAAISPKRPLQIEQPAPKDEQR